MAVKNSVKSNTRTALARNSTPAAKARRTAANSRKAIQKQKFTKTQILNEIAQNTELSKNEVSAVLEELNVLIERHIMKRSIGEFTLPGLLKIKTVARPARPARKNVPNPFKPGELMDIARKPASTRVRILPLKKLKEFVL
ncbi:MAG: HU family DNA-binding protein [Pseudohongiellaceae bacterium]